MKKYCTSAQTCLQSNSN